MHFRLSEIEDNINSVTTTYERIYVHSFIWYVYKPGVRLSGLKINESQLMKIRPFPSPLPI